MTTAEKQLVKATVPFLKEHGVELTKHFYSRMFTHNPELKNVFNMGNQQNAKQQTALATAVLAYAEHIDHPEVLLPVINSIGQKHVSLDIRAEHYLIVGTHLLAAIAEVAGDAASEELLSAWRSAYFQLADIMSGHELELYKKQVQQTGGWSGWRPFIVRQKVQESTEITSFYLYPADGGPVSQHLPGQYVSVRVFLPQLNLLQPRQYSISSAPNGEYYRISVKKETGAHPTPDGTISNYLHNEVAEGSLVDVSAPAGNFILQDTGRPVVFISGGIGQTPLLAMLESLVGNDSERPVTWIHGCRNKEVHAFESTIDKWTADDKYDKHIFYNDLGGVQAKDYLYEGWVELARVQQALEPSAEYYICGPAPFIEKHYRDLVNMGINKSSIFFEEFGPQTLNLN